LLSQPDMEICYDVWVIGGTKLFHFLMPRDCVHIIDHIRLLYTSVVQVPITWTEMVDDEKVDFERPVLGVALS